jgi:endonuclease/exonuclease/phosphatase family metal-dependent hydrolase
MNNHFINRKSVRVSQTAIMMEELAIFLGDEAQSTPIILTGDLNSIPTNNVYKLLSTSKLKNVEFGSQVCF